MGGEVYRPYDFIGVFQRDAKQIVDAREKCITIHRDGDIKAAGDEVEITVRDILAKRLNSYGLIGSGQIVDAYGRISSELDFLLYDPQIDSPFDTTKSGKVKISLASSQIIGEIKSSFRREGSVSNIDNFLDVVREIRDYRSNSPIELEKFFFMLLVSGVGFNIESLSKRFSETPLTKLPNAICLLDQGVIVNMNTAIGPDGSRLLGPSTQSEVGGQSTSVIVPTWVLIKHNNPEEAAGWHLFLLNEIMTRFVHNRYSIFGRQDILALLPDNNWLVYLLAYPSLEAFPAPQIT